MKQPSRSENDKYSASEVAESSKVFALKDRENTGNAKTKLLTGDVFAHINKLFEDITTNKQQDNQTREEPNSERE